MKQVASSRWDNYKAIVRLGLPIMIGQLGIIVVGFADNIMVGHYSTIALASASFVNNLFNVANFVCIGFTYGITPIVASLFSRRMNSEIGATVNTAVILNLLFALLVTAVMSLFYVNLEKMGQPEELLPTIRPYFLIYLAGLVPVSLFNVFAQWSYAVNNTKMPMWIILASNMLNIAGNYVLIYGNLGFPELGLTGAGLSTLAARVMCPLTIIGIFFFERSNREYATGFMSGGSSRNRWRKIGRTSWPISMQMMFESGSFTFSAIVAGWLGTIELAAFQIIVIVGMFGFCIYYSIGAATSVLVANANGLSDRAGMRRIAYAGYHITLFSGAIASMIFIFGGRTLISAFTDDEVVIATTMTLIFPLVLYQLGDATQINFANALRGTANVMPMLWIAFVSYIVIGCPATYLIAIPFGMGIYGIILSFSVSLFIAAGFFVYYFLRTTATKSVR